MFLRLEYSEKKVIRRALRRVSIDVGSIVESCEITSYISVQDFHYVFINQYCDRARCLVDQMSRYINARMKF